MVLHNILKIPVFYSDFIVFSISFSFIFPFLDDKGSM